MPDFDFDSEGFMITCAEEVTALELESIERTVRIRVVLREPPYMGALRTRTRPKPQNKSAEKIRTGDSLLLIQSQPSRTTVQFSHPQHPRDRTLQPNKKGQKAPTRQRRCLKAATSINQINQINISRQRSIHASSNPPQLLMIQEPGRLRPRESASYLGNLKSNKLDMNGIDE